MTNDELILVKEWIERINDEAVNVTEWELGFMESITEQMERTGSLSDKQKDIVERIYTNKVP